MILATWNLFWLGEREGEKIVRSAEDEALIARIIAKIAPDVLALQELVDPLAMERILAQVRGPGRQYALRQGELWFTSDPTPEKEKHHAQKVFLCVNTETMEVLGGATLRGGPDEPGAGLRLPWAARLRHKASGRTLTAVTVHLRAGYPELHDQDDAQNRRKQAEALTAWLQGRATAENPDFPRPEDEEVVVMGDFNAERNAPGQPPRDPNDSLRPFAEALPGWQWEDPQADGPHEHTAIYGELRLVLDYMVLSPALARDVQRGPALYAWDHDPEFDGPGKFHENDDPACPLRDFQVTDHRPVVAEVEW